MTGDMRFALRALWRSRGFTAAAVLTLAIGVAGATVMFTLVNGVLLQPLPVRDQGRLIVTWKRAAVDAGSHWPFGADGVRAVRDHARLLEAVAPFAYNGAMDFVAVENDVASHIRVAAVGGDFFRVLGLNPIAGRAIEAADDRPGAEHVVVIGEQLWRQRYGAASDVVGRRLTLSELPFVIAGVVPDADLPRGAQAWISLESFVATIKTDAFKAAGARDHDMVARIKPGVTIAQASDEIHAINEEVERTAAAGAQRGGRPVMRSYEEAVVGDIRRPVWLLFAAVTLVVAIATANAANLSLLRSESRAGEHAVRIALGANRWVLTRDTIAESVLLGAMAATIGLIASWWSLDVFVALSPADLPRASNVRIDAVAAAFAITLGIGTALVAGAIGAVVSMRAQPIVALRASGTRSVSGASRAGRRTLVVAQVALSLVVIAAAGMLTRTLLQLQSVGMGMATDGLIFAELFFPQAEYPVNQRRHFFDQLIAQLNGVAGVERVTPIGVEPYAGLAGWDIPRFVGEGQSAESAAANPPLNLEPVHPEHFSTLDVHVVRGRAITDQDTRNTPNVALVSEDVAARVWPGEDPIGKRMKMGGIDSTAQWFTVVGVAETTRYRELAEPRPTMYVAAAQFIDAAANLAIRGTASVDVVAGLLRDRVREIDPDVYVLRVQPFEAFLAKPLAQPRFIASVSNVFGGLALVLAAVGLYAVLAAFVRQTRREIGVRIALGATAAQVRAFVAREAMLLAGIGIVLGVGSVIATGGLLRGLLFGVQPADPSTIALAVGVLVLTTAAACYVPIRQATRLDPVALLRQE
jgi:putative ABC transport system permease protein